MGDVIHLGKIRKARKRAAEQIRADENAARHGRTRAEREREAAGRRRQNEAVDGARLDSATPLETGLRRPDSVPLEPIDGVEPDEPG